MAEPAPLPAKEPQRASVGLEWAKVVGTPVATVLITVIGGSFLTDWMKQREAAQGNARLYAQLLTQREQSDAQLRKDMFGVVIKSFLTEPKEGDWSNKVLQLELLATNFSQSLDLAPLFKDLARRLPKGQGPGGSQFVEFRRRLDMTASNLISKQVSALARHGVASGKVVAVSEVDAAIGTPWIDVSVPLSRLAPGERGRSPAGAMARFSVEVVGINLETRQVEVRLRVDLPDSRGSEDVDRHFWVGLYDFPMLDNTQLPYGLRTSVVLTEFFVAEGKGIDQLANSFFQLHVVVFPAGSASFKERQDYDDILSDMLRAQSEQVETASKEKP